MTDEAEFRLVVRIRNAVMLRAMERAGYRTQTELCLAADVTGGQLGAYLNLRLAPQNQRGEWRAEVLRISSALRTEPEFLFPKGFLTRALARSRVERDLTRDQVDLLMIVPPSPERRVVEDGAKRALGEALQTLRPRLRTVLAERFGLGDEGVERTLEDLSGKFGVGRERIRQLEARALRVLRHPSRSKALRQHLDALSEDA